MAAIQTYHRDEFDARDLAAAKRGRTVSVVIPARDEEATIGDIVAAIRGELIERTPLVDELLVVDDRSVDGTGPRSAAAGARVVTTAALLPELGAGSGKGDAVWKGTAAATGDLVAFVDGDVTDFRADFVVGLLGPLLRPRRASAVRFVKGFYERPIDGAPRGGGRVTELTARPVIAALLPALSPIVQPLAGEFAAPRSVLAQLPVVQGYGVDIGLLADVAATFGVGSIAQVDLGRRVHRNRPLHELGPMATEVLLTALSRCGVEVPASVLLQMPDFGAVEVSLRERPPLRDVLGDRGAP